MSAETDRFDRVQADYLTLVRKSLARWDCAVNDAREGRWSLSAALSDMFVNWMEAATFSFNLFSSPTPPQTPPQMGAAPPQVPTVSLTLDARQTTASAAKVVQLDSGTPVVATKLARADQAAGGEIAAAHVSAHLEDEGRVLVVQLDLGKGRRPAAGEYRGFVQGAGANVAFITVTVR